MNMHECGAGVAALANIKWFRPMYLAALWKQKGGEVAKPCKTPEHSGHLWSQIRSSSTGNRIGQECGFI